MTPRVTRGLFLFFLFLTSLSYTGAAEETVWGGDGEGALLLQAADALLNNEREEARSLLMAVSPQGPAQRAWSLLLQGDLALLDGDKTGAGRYYEEAEGVVQGRDGYAGTAEGLYLIAEARSRLMLTKGVFYIIQNASSVEEYALAALEKEPGMEGARLIVAQGRINAPPLFGGDPAEGRDLLEQVLQEEGLLKRERFIAFYSMALAYSKEESWEEAASFIQKALSLYPGNLMARQLRDEIRESR